MKRKLRVVNHLACTGGSLISRCVAAQRDVVLLSEVHPFSKRHIGGKKSKFLPSDLITQLRFSKYEIDPKTCLKLFIAQLNQIIDLCEETNENLVLRVHAHSDYCCEPVKPLGNSLISHLTEEYDLVGITTIRNPIQSYISLLRNGWVHFNQPSFDKYCERYLLFLDENLFPIFKYEEFVRTPHVDMKKMSEALKLSFNEDFEFSISDIFVSGNSGRQYSSIKKTRKKRIPRKMVAEIENSEKYYLLNKKMGY